MNQVNTISSSTFLLFKLGFFFVSSHTSIITHSISSTCTQRRKKQEKVSRTSRHCNPTYKETTSDCSCFSPHYPSQVALHIIISAADCFRARSVPTEPSTGTDPARIGVVFYIAKDHQEKFRLEIMLNERALNQPSPMSLSTALLLIHQHHDNSICKRLVHAL